MVKKILLLLVSCLIVLSLLLASCAPAVVEEEKKAPVVEEKKKEEVAKEEKVVVPEKEMVKDSLGRMVEKPKYGGTFTYAWLKAMRPWDQGISSSSLYRINMVAQPLVTGDWAKGPAGTGEASFQDFMYVPPEHIQTGCLAESWELVDPVTMVFHIRKRVHFHNKPPVNGREMTADDVVFSLDRLFTLPTGRLHLKSPGNLPPKSITALDKYTVEIVAPDPVTAPTMFEIIRFDAFIIPHEVIEKYGDMNSWENVCGTGAFIVEDEVANASTSFVKNPNYWEKDPLQPENQLPYLDRIRWMVIPDVSTLLAATRARKIDAQKTISWEDGELLLQSNPDLQYLRYLLTAFDEMLVMKCNDPDLPWYDKRVRHALALAIDHPAIADDFYGGNAVMLASPVVPLPEHDDWYVPLEELPANVQELYEYHPDKAKQLLAEAGYADGFKCSIVCRAKDVPFLSLIESWWDDIGVDLEIDVKESGVFYSIVAARSFPNMLCYGVVSGAFSGLANLLDPTLGGRNDLPMVDDARVNEFSKKLREAYYDYDEKCRLVKEILPYIHEQCWWIPAPDKYLYFMWQPWLHNLHGEYALAPNQYFAHYRYLWIDQDLKEELTGVR